MLTCVQISVVLQLLGLNIRCCAHFSNLIHLSLFKTTKTSSTKIREPIITPFLSSVFAFSSNTQHPAPSIQHPSSSTHHSNIEQYTASRYTPDRKWIYNTQTKDIQGIVKSHFIFSLINSVLPENTPDNKRLHHI